MVVKILILNFRSIIGDYFMILRFFIWYVNWGKSLFMYYSDCEDLGIFLLLFIGCLEIVNMLEFWIGILSLMGKFVKKGCGNREIFCVVYWC